MRVIGAVMALITYYNTSNENDPHKDKNDNPKTDVTLAILGFLLMAIFTITTNFKF